MGDSLVIIEEQLDLSKAVADTKSILHDEISINGRVNWSVWYRLFSAPPLGWFGFCLLIFVVLFGEILFDASNWWLAIWVSKSYNIQQRVPLLAYTYFALALATFVVAIVRGKYWFYVMLRGSDNLHSCMLKGILYTSMRFFESNPSGRIINRASRDQQVIDELLPMTMFDAIQELLAVAGSAVIISIINPLILLSFIPLVPVCCYYCHYYLRSSRQLKRLESVTRSPVYTLFSSSLNGLTSIRAFQVEENFKQTFIDRIDANTRAYLTMMSATFWLGFRLNCIAGLFVLVTALLSVTIHNQMKPAFVALSLMCCLNLILKFQWGLQQFAEAENYMTSAERIDEYAHLTPEEDNGGNQRLIQTSTDWPSGGSIQFQNYTLRYRSELEPVLYKIDLRIEPGENIGIIGRTGKRLACSLYH
jgi:ATP-binding cassette subfamily C (CFTR/MRP) protein 4